MSHERFSDPLSQIIERRCVLTGNDALLRAAVSNVLGPGDAIPSVLLGSFFQGLKFAAGDIKYRSGLSSGRGAKFCPFSRYHRLNKLP